MFCKCSPKYVSCSFYLPRRIVEMSDIIGRYCPEERTQRFSRRELRSLRAAWSPRGLLAIQSDVSSDIGIREANNIQPIICGVCWGTVAYRVTSTLFTKTVTVFGYLRLGYNVITHVIRRKLHARDVVFLCSAFYTRASSTVPSIIHMPPLSQCLPLRWTRISWPHSKCHKVIVLH